MNRVKKFFGAILFHRKTLRANLSDISLVGAIIILLFYTSNTLWLPSVIAYIFSPPSLGGADVLTLWNLLLATFPLTIGLCFTITMTASSFVKLSDYQAGKISKSPSGWSYLYRVAGIWLLSLIVSAILSVGGIHGADIGNLLFGHTTVTCSPLPKGCQLITTGGLVDLNDRSNDGAIAMPISFLFGTISLLWQIYGARVFLLGILLSCYIDWAIFIKIRTTNETSLKPLTWQKRDTVVALGTAYYAQRAFGTSPYAQYWSAVGEAWASQVLDPEKIQQLTALAQTLALSNKQVALIEEEVMGDTKERIFARLDASHHSRTTARADTPPQPETPAPSQKIKEQWLQEGHTLWYRKRYQEALVACEQAIRLDPNFALAHHNKGTTLLDIKRYQEALAAYEQAIRLDPNLALAYNGKGNALWHLQRYEEALAAYEQTIHLEPNLALAYNGKGATLLNLQRCEEALAAYEQTIHLDPNFALAYSNEGATLLNLQRHQEALVACKQAIRLDPSLALAYNNKGGTLLYLERYEEALRSYEQAIRLDPSLALAYVNKGVTLLYLERYPPALAACKRAIRLDPNLAQVYNAHVYHTKGTKLLNRKQYEEALAAYEQATCLDPNLAQVYNGKGAALLNLKRYEEALAAYEQAILLDPNFALAYKNKGHLLKILRRSREAEEAFQKARECRLHSKSR